MGHAGVFSLCPTSSRVFNAWSRGGISSLVEGKSHLTNTLKIYLSQWAKYLSWQKVAEIFNVSWQNVFESVEHVVEYDLKHRCFEGIKSIGIDEIQYRTRHN